MVIRLDHVLLARGKTANSRPILRLRVGGDGNTTTRKGSDDKMAANPRRLRSGFLSTAAAALVLAGFGLVDGAGAMGLAPHRAVYDMSLERAASGSGITEVTGRMAFEMIGSPCEGYAVNMRFISRIAGDQRNTTTDLQSATYETADGSSYRFVTRNRFDGGEPEVTDGVAQREDGEVVVDLSRPEEASVELKGMPLFPTQHIREILQAARKGDRILPAEVYDGSDGGRKRYVTTTAIGERGHRAGDSSAERKLGQTASWPVTIAYFDETAEDGGELPSYEFSYALHENGVSTDLVLDYGNFAIKGTLSELEFVELPDCER